VADFNPAEALLENGSLKAAVLPYDASRWPGRARRRGLDDDRKAMVMTEAKTALATITRIEAYDPSGAVTPGQVAAAQEKRSSPARIKRYRDRWIVLTIRFGWHLGLDSKCSAADGPSTTAELHPAATGGQPPSARSDRGLCNEFPSCNAGLSSRFNSPLRHQA
jgi:hypothetical protein